MKIKYLRCCALLVLLFSALSAGPAIAKDWFYTVRSDDSLWSICSTYVERRLCFIELGEYNKLSRHNLIAPGSVIRIPYAWLRNPPQPALVVYSRGQVKYLPAEAAATLAWKQVEPASGIAGLTAAGVALQSLPEDSKIFMGDRIITGEGNVRVEFGDGSQMIIRAQSDVIFDRLSIHGDTSFVNTLLILKRGSTTNKVEPRQGRSSRFNIRTPAGVAAVRGTEFRVSVDAQNAEVMRSEVLEGRVAVGDLKAASEQPVDEGFGVRNEAGKPIPPPRELLPAPLWQGDPEASLGVPFTVSWQDVPGADYYLVDRLDSGGLVETLRAETAQLDFAALDDGNYRLVVSAVDEVGLRGLEAERGLQVMTPLPVPELAATSMIAADEKTLQLDWAEVEAAQGYRVEVSRHKQFTRIIKTQQTALPTFTHKSGRPVYVRVIALYEDGSESEPSTVVAWQPDTDYAPWVIGVWSILFVLVVI